MKPAGAASDLSTTINVARRFATLVVPFWWSIVSSLALGTATVGASVGLMGTAAWLIATAALHPSIADLQIAVVGVRFFGVSRGVFRYAERLISHDLTFRLLAGLRVWFIEALAPLAPARLLDRSVSDLVDRADFDESGHVIAQRLIRNIATCDEVEVVLAKKLRVVDLANKKPR
ncbi:MAG: hypothetical protein ABFS37_08700, partial [Acidobacteriota bacterium]